MGFIFVWGPVYAMALSVEIRRHLVGGSALSPLCGSGIPTQVATLDDNCLYLLSLLTGSC